MAYYQHNMLSIKSRTILANLLAEVVLLSESIESYREALANIDYFDCIALFRFLDREEKGYLREKDFERVMGTSHRKLLTYAFSWFDNMKVGEISRLEFAVFLLPKDNLELRQVVAERVQNPQISCSQHETILTQFDIFRSLLLEIMNRQMKIIELRRSLVRNDDYSSKGLFSAIDCNNHQWICSQDLYKFLKNYGFDVNLRHVEKLMEVINYNFDGKISEQQLSWTVQGFESKNKAYLNKVKACNKKEENIKKKYNPQQQIIVQENKQSTPSSISQEFKILMEKIRLAELQEKQVDDQLLKCDMHSIEENKRLCELKIEETNRKKRANGSHQYWAQREKQRLAEEYGKNGAREALLRQRELLVEAERFKKLEDKLLYHTDGVPFAQIGHNYDYNRRLYSFAEDSPKNASFGRHFEIIDAHIPPRKDYQYLTNLNSLSIIESYRKGTSRSYGLSDSSYLNAASEMREKIRKKLEIERSIQDKFSKGEYNTSRFNSRVEPKQAISKSKITQRDELKPKDEGHREFESPQRVPSFKKSAANKFTVSTGNKLSNEKVY